MEASNYLKLTSIKDLNKVKILYFMEAVKEWTN
jgi:hypothetical protein